MQTIIIIIIILISEVGLTDIQVEEQLETMIKLFTFRRVIFFETFNFLIM